MTNTLIELKNKILYELEISGIPDLAFLYSEKSLQVIPELLGELLDEEIIKFHKLLETPDSDINFEIFEDEDKLGHLFGLVSHLDSINSTDEVRKIIEDFRPRYIDFGNEVAYSKRFYDMHIICRNNCDLNGDQRRLLDISIRDFEQSGIHLDEDKKNRLKQINQELAKLSFDFSNNKLDSEKEFKYFFDKIDSIKEMPEDDLEVAKAKAKELGQEGYAFTSDDSSYIAVMKYCSDSSVRKHFKLSRSRYATETGRDNRPLILDILRLKKECASILGHANYAKYSLVDKMADSPEEIIKLEKEIIEKAKLKGNKDLEELKNFFDLNEINSWDTSYYSRILKEKKYEVSDKELKKYFELEKVLGGLFDIAKKLYSLEFKRIDIKTYDSEVRFFEVYKSGEFKSYFMMDLFYRKEKSSGAWANILRKGEVIKGKRKLPIVINVCSFQKGTDTKTLLNYGDVNTLFHEFGHALHAMLGNSDYSGLNGFHVEHDFVELPSQIMENWSEGEGLKSFAVQDETGEIIPDLLLEKLNKLSTFMSGLGTLGQSEYAMIDMLLYSEEPPKSVEELDRKVFEIKKSISIFEVSEEDKFHAGFEHIFSGGYSAGYYGYLWAEIIEADIFGEFKKNGIFNKEVADKFYSTILSQGTRKPAKELFEDFMGREVSVETFFEKMGFN
ncbi:MAG: M3 family metallopeptidase [Candidatus Gracilibacteria bacterium]|nr:M3 family metallopeptidase [Candidatus Gracilibacteria bacterium]MDD2908127.1 M3 family metallopeptidase [Candidatus Gracilibacteria bacterium]